MKNTLFLAVLLAACSAPADKPGDPKPVETSATVEVFEHPDPGPVLQVDTELPPAAELGEVRLEATAKYCTKTHCYVGVAADGRVSEARFADGALPHAVWTPTVIRVVAPQVPDILTTRFVRMAPSLGLERARETGTAVVNVSAATPLDGELEKRFWDALAVQMAQEGQGSSFSNFVALRTQARAGRPAGDRRTEFYDLMSLYTGMTSIQEALQYDRVVRVAGEKRTESVDVTSIEGVPVPPHPWTQMLAEVGTPPVVEPLAAYIPHDMAYLHCGDLREFVRLMRDIDEWLAPAAQLAEIKAGHSQFTKTYEKMLVVERTGLAEALGHMAADGVALTLGDPFLREGSDVSLVFHVRNRAALKAALGTFEANARQTDPGIQDALWKHKDVVVRRVFSADGLVEQNTVELGDVLIVSNSRGAIRRFVDTFHKQVPSLAGEGDFRYMRAKYPHDTTETGFLFLSDAFVARAVSPTVKILEARRMQARADQMALHNGVLMFGKLEGRVPKNLNEVVSAGYLDQEHLKHFDGQRIDFDVSTGAVSGWGTSRFMTPIRDLALTKVTAEERDAYVRFRDTYQQYWRAFIDPVGIRIVRSQRGWELDGRMLPLIQNSDYDELIELVGTTKVNPVVSPSGGQFVFAIGQDARLRRELNSVAGQFLGSSGATIGWLGDWVTVGLESRSGLWDLAVASGAIPQHAVVDTQRTSVVHDQLSSALSRAPFYAGAHVVNSVAFGAFITAIKGFVSSAAPGMIDWAETAHYRDIPVVRVGTRPGAPEGDIAAYYALHNGAFVIAMDRPTLEIQLDRIVAGTWPGTATQTDADTQAQAAAHLANSWLATTVLAMAETVIQREHARSARAHQELVQGLPGLTTSAQETQRLALIYLGLVPQSPHGGTFAYTNGWVSHSLYGSVLVPQLPGMPIEDSDLTRAIRATQSVGGQLDFEGEGNHRGLRVRVQLQR